MNKLWLIAQYEYERRVLRRSFLLGTLSVPLAMGIAVVATRLLRSLSGASASPAPALLGAGHLLPALAGVLFVLLVVLSFFIRCFRRS